MQEMNKESEHRMTDVFFAKSGNKDGQWITVKQHLTDVSGLAGQFGKEIDMEQEAALAGIFHDFGKYSDAFQQVLTGEKHHQDHAFGGAAFLNGWIKAYRNKAYQPIIEAVNGHHDGLVEYLPIKDDLKIANKMKTDKEDEDDVD